VAIGRAESGSRTFGTTTGDTEIGPELRAIQAYGEGILRMTETGHQRTHRA
jgi:hypothetical protein